MRWTFDELQPAHVAAGLGGASRDFLCVCLGIFDDATLRRQLKSVLQKAAKLVPVTMTINGVELTAEVEDAADKWRRHTGLSDRHLRAILWARLQGALGIAPQPTRSVRGCERLVDDLVASALRGGGDSGRDRSEGTTEAAPGTLGGFVAPLLTKLVAEAMAEDSRVPQKDKERFVAETAAQLGEEERQTILREIGDQDFERGLGKWLATGGAYGSLGVAVGASGFAPYILAAQASAFIPFVSGPALTSLLSVIANPVVVVAGIAGLGYYLGRKADQKAAASVATHLIALLACDGIGRPRDAVEELVASFETIPELGDDTFKSEGQGPEYRARWREVRQAQPRRSANSPVRPALADDWEGTDINRNSVGVGALSVGDLVYSLAAIEPGVVAAADFSSSDEISDPFDLAVDLFEKMSDGWYGRESFEGLVNSQKGFLMEQLVATKLTADGHAVAFPETPNQPGWDLIVDGQPFQVKCLADSAGLAEHFDNYPDIPVLANSDLIVDYDAWPAEWRDNVYFMEGHTNELLSQVTERSYLEAKDLGDNDVPEIALAFVAARQIWKLKGGEVTATQAASQLLIEGSTRVGLAVGGGVVGTSIGLLVLGPAGALVGGALAPVFAQAATGRLASWVREATGLDAEEDKKINAKSDALAQSVEKAIKDKLFVLRDKFRKVGGGMVGEFVRYRLADEGRHLQECRQELSRLERDRRDVRRRADSIVRIALRSAHPSRYQRPLGDLLRALRG